MQGEVPAGARVELGKAKTLRIGTDLTLVSWSRAVHASLEAAEAAATRGVSVEVLDLRTIWPWDRDAVLASAAKTRRLLVVHEAIQAAGFGAEIAASVAEQLGIPVARLGGPRIPVGYAPTLEAEARIDGAKILARVLGMTEGSSRKQPVA